MMNPPPPACVGGPPNKATSPVPLPPALWAPTPTLPAGCPAGRGRRGRQFGVLPVPPPHRATPLPSPGRRREQARAGRSPHPGCPHGRSGCPKFRGPCDWQRAGERRRFGAAVLLSSRCFQVVPERPPTPLCRGRRPEIQAMRPEAAPAPSSGPCPAHCRCHVPCAVCHVPRAVCHVPSAVGCVPCTVCHAPYAARHALCRVLSATRQAPRAACRLLHGTRSVSRHVPPPVPRRLGCAPRAVRCVPRATRMAVCRVPCAMCHAVPRAVYHSTGAMPRCCRVQHTEC